MRGFASGYVHDDWPERQRGAMTHFLPPLLSSIFNLLLFLNHLTVHSKWNNTCSLQLAHQVCDLKLTWYYTFLLPDSKKHNVNVLMAASIFYTQCRAWGEIKECELMHIWTDVYYCTSIKRYVTRCSLNTGELCVFLLTTLTGLNQFRWVFFSFLLKRALCLFWWNTVNVVPLQHTTDLSASPGMSLICYVSMKRD